MVVDYTTSTTIKIEPAERHHFFNVSRPDAKGRSKYKKKFPAIRMSPDVWEQASLKADYVELRFDNASGMHSLF